MKSEKIFFTLETLTVDQYGISWYIHRKHPDVTNLTGYWVPLFLHIKAIEIPFLWH